MKSIILKSIISYKKTISPIVGFFGYNCRFYPSCSVYAVRSVEQKGAFRGIMRAAWRIMRCGPWSKGGIDHVK